MITAANLKTVLQAMGFSQHEKAAGFDADWTVA